MKLIVFTSLPSISAAARYNQKSQVQFKMSHLFKTAGKIKKKKALLPGTVKNILQYWENGSPIYKCSHFKYIHNQIKDKK